MEPNSILSSTKKILGIGEDYTHFDVDITMHINSVFSTLNQLGIGPADGFSIEDKSKKWEDFTVPPNQLGLIRELVYLKTRALFDPPTTSFMIEAVDRQIRECEWRLSVFREGVEHPLPEEVA